MKIEPPAIEKMWRQFSQLASGLSTVTDQEFNALDINSLRDALLSCLHILDQAIKHGDRAALEHLYLLTLQGCSLLKKRCAQDGELVNGSRDRMPQIDKLLSAVSPTEDEELLIKTAGPIELAALFFRQICDVKRYNGREWSSLPRGRTTLAVSKLRIDAKSAVQAKEPRAQRQLIKAILKLTPLSKDTYKQWWAEAGAPLFDAYCACNDIKPSKPETTRTLKAKVRRAFYRVALNSIVGVRCDGCGKVKRGESLQRILGAIKKAGWEKKSGRHYCRGCVSNGLVVS